MKTLAARGLAAALLLCVLAAPSLATNGTRLVGNGARTAGRAGVDYAFADDATAIATNPAGLGFIDGNRLDQSFFVIRPAYGWHGETDDSETSEIIPSASLGVVLDLDEPAQLDAFLLGEGKESRTPSRTSAAFRGSGIKLGFGVFPIAGSKVDHRFATPFWSEQNAAVGTREEREWGADLKQVAFSFALAWRLSPQVSIGIAPSFVYSIFENDQPVAQPREILQGRPVDGSDATYASATPFLGQRQINGFGDLDATGLASGAETYGFRLRLGLFLQPLDFLSIGLTYATQTFQQDYLAETRIDFNRQLATIDPNRALVAPILEANTGIPAAQQTYAGDANLRLKPLEAPQEVGLGIGFRFPRVSFGVDVTWLQWSATYDAIEGRLTEGTSRELNELTSDGADTVHLYIPLEWEDQLVFAVGGAVAVTDSFVLRAGYNYAKSPIPSDTLLPTAPAILEHHVTFGASLYVRRIELSLSCEYALPSKRTIRNHKGDENLEGDELEVSALFIGLGIGVSF